VATHITIDVENDVDRWAVKKAATGEVIQGGFDTRQQAWDVGFALNLPMVEPGTYNATPSALRPGWSDAARSRRTSTDHGVGAALGLASSARGTSCHYCGLDYRSCDCG